MIFGCYKITLKTNGTFYFKVAILSTLIPAGEVEFKTICLEKPQDDQELL